MESGKDWITKSSLSARESNRWNIKSHNRNKLARKTFSIWAIFVAVLLMIFVPVMGSVFQAGGDLRIFTILLVGALAVLIYVSVDSVRKRNNSNVTHVGPTLFICFFLLSLSIVASIVLIIF